MADPETDDRHANICAIDSKANIKFSSNETRTRIASGTMHSIR